MGIPFQDLLNELDKHLLPITAISEDGKLDRWFNRLDPFHTLADLSDRSRIGKKRDKQDQEEKGKSF
jgi:hypothetical protein